MPQIGLGTASVGGWAGVGIIFKSTVICFSKYEISNDWFPLMQRSEIQFAASEYL